MLKELFMIASTILPEEQLVKKVHDASEKVLADPSDEDAKKELTVMSQMYILHTIHNGDPKKAMEIMQDIDKEDKLRAVFKEGQFQN